MAARASGLPGQLDVARVVKGALAAGLTIREVVATAAGVRIITSDAPSDGRVSVLKIEPEAGEECAWRDADPL